jgi:hypothetical protein
MRGAMAMGYVDGLKGDISAYSSLTINELIDIFYAESVHICPDETEASALAISALNDFLESHSTLICYS